MFSRPVSSGWKPVPTSSRLATRPRILTRPSVGSVMRERILSSVILPAPLRPMMPSTSPRLTSKLTSLSAQNSSTASPATIGAAAHHVGRRAPEIVRATRPMHVAQRDIALALGLRGRSRISCRAPRRGCTTSSAISDQVREGALGAAEIGDAEPQKDRDDAEAEQEARACKAGWRRRAGTSGSRR